MRRVRLRRYELLDGVLVVSPRPTTIHQFVAMRLLRALANACHEDLCVVPEPAVELGPQTEFDPDLVVAGNRASRTASLDAGYRRPLR